MPSPPERQFTMPVMKELFTNHELLMREASRASAESSEGGGVRKVGILGGGTAGWFTALALRAQLPWLDVTVIESPSIPIIGVGEASVPSLVAFLHHYLKLDVLDFTREVRPTWKQGIRFEWGLPGSYVFQAPFDWEVNGVGMLGSMAETGDINSFTVQAMLMARDVTPVIRSGGRLETFLPLFAFAYHLDNQRLVAYVTAQALARGVHHIDAKVVDAALVPTPAGGDDEPEIAHLVTDGGQKLEFDLYIDCSGFRSALLGQKLGAKYQSFAPSLFTDSALAFNAPHGGKLKPYTTARTMQNGWCWDIPMMENDHLGYVFSSSYCSEDEALAEARGIWPDLTSERIVRFKSGRHDRLWVGNVFAIGNSYAFVEPLESTGLLMITRAITSLVRAFPIGRDNTVMKRFVNTTVGRDWDRLRWFLSAHYKFNRRLDSRFWTDVRAGADISGIENAVELFKTMGPLSILPRTIRQSVLDEAGVFFYGLAGLDCILMGQKVPYPKLEREPPSTWGERRRTAVAFAKRALPQAEAIAAVKERPTWLRELVDHPSSWVAKSGILSVDWSDMGEPVEEALLAAQSRVGRIIRDKWRIDALLGSGRVSDVFAGTHRGGKRIAIRVLHATFAADSTTRQAFLDGAYVANRIEHPSVVSVLDDDVDDDGAPFIVTELLDGETVDARWARSGHRLGLVEVLWMADRVLEVLAIAHAQGIAHGRLRAANLFLSGASELRVMDFGMSRLGAAEPRGAGDARADLRAIGAMMQALLADRSGAQDDATASVPVDVAALIQRALVDDGNQGAVDANLMRALLRQPFEAAMRPPPVEVRRTPPPDALPHRAPLASLTEPTIRELPTQPMSPPPGAPTDAQAPSDPADRGSAHDRFRAASAAAAPEFASDRPQAATGARLIFANQLAHVYFQRATQRESVGDHAGAIEDYTKALERLPNHALAHYNRGVARHALGEREEAAKDYARAIELEPEMADAFYNCALLHWDLTHYEAAVRYAGVAERLYEQRSDQRMAAEAGALVKQIVAEYKAR